MRNKKSEISPPGRGANKQAWALLDSTPNGDGNELSLADAPLDRHLYFFHPLLRILDM